MTNIPNGCCRPPADHSKHVKHTEEGKRANLVAQAVAQGFWCRDCEFFESGEDMGEQDCNACGCRREDHVPVVVVPLNRPGVSDGDEG